MLLFKLTVFNFDQPFSQKNNLKLNNHVTSKFEAIR